MCLPFIKMWVSDWRSLSRVQIFAIVHEILQARMRVAFPFSKGSSQPRNWIQVLCITGGFFTNWSHKGSPRILEWVAYPFSSRSSGPRNQTGVACNAGEFFTNWAMRGALSSNRAFFVFSYCVNLDTENVLGRKWNHITVSICISLITSEAGL